MMFSIPDKPKVCPVCGSDARQSDSDEVAEFRCGAEWALDHLVGRDLKSYPGYICLKQCPWATIIVIELLAGKLYDPSVPRFKQAGL